MESSSPVTTRRPPDILLRIFNPVLRAVLGSPLAPIVRAPFVVLRFRGRRSGREYAIPVSWFDLDGGKAVFTPAGWRANFRGGAPVTVVHRDGRSSGTGTLVDDPGTVADALRRLLDAGADARMLGLDMPAGHHVTADDVRAVRRAMIRLELPTSTARGDS
jgi:hypothetical protein